MGGKKGASAAAGAIVSWLLLETGMMGLLCSVPSGASVCVSQVVVVPALPKAPLCFADTVLMCVVESRPLLTGSGRLLLRRR